MENSTNGFMDSIPTNNSHRLSRAVWRAPLLKINTQGMLAVHWSPVKNTKNILHNGIHKSKGGVYCFPLTGQPSLDKWWANAFRRRRPRTAYNGFVFRIVQSDLPASFWTSPRNADNQLSKDCS
jgi:hypothetical protein